MNFVPGSIRIFYGPDTDPVSGTVKWKPSKSLWIGAMTAIALVFGPLTFTWGAFAVFMALSAITLCAGHSVGMHRRMIHHAFECPLWVEYLLIELGVLVGMAGPFGMIRQHDVRDWSQRQAHCHDFLCHRRPILRDYFEQLHCELRQPNGPELRIEPRLANDPVYTWLERTWRWHQLPLAIALFALGGWSWVVWGVAVRVSVCVTGHWLISYYAHREGPQSWIVRGAGVQGYNLPVAALFSMGESWHNNHHAFPASAQIGLYPDQPDAGWWLIVVLKRFGLVHHVITPEALPPRPALQRLTGDHVGWSALRRLGPHGSS
jgi:fatty-acid desaturase